MSGKRIRELKKINRVPQREYRDVSQYLASQHEYKDEKYRDCDTVMQCITRDFYRGDEDLYFQSVVSLERIIRTHPLFDKYKNDQYTISVVYESMENRCCICDQNLVSNLYEESALTVVGEDITYGFMLKGREQILSVAVVDLNPQSDMTKSSSLETAELVLLCKNKDVENGLTHILLDYVKTWCGLMGKKYLRLVIANSSKNNRAKNFYIRNGFVDIGGGVYVSYLSQQHIDDRKSST